MTRPWFQLRLEARRPAGDPERGFAAEIADPAWFLGRQWQLGEHQGENASSPISVDMTLRLVPLEPLPARASELPSVVPIEALVEDEVDSWWTIGRRLRLGLAAREAGLVKPPNDERFLFKTLSGPYEELNGIAYDGQAVFAEHSQSRLFAVVPTRPAAADAWSTSDFVYRASVTVGNSRLHIGGHTDPDSDCWVGHDGGDIDWWSVDADGPVIGGVPQHAVSWPERFSWPGGPARRWWQIEDRAVDLGSMSPDRSHFGTVLLIDLLCSHGDDWFLAPIPASGGHVLAIDRCLVTDAFGDPWEIITAAPQVPAGQVPWSMFAVAGLGRYQLPIWLKTLSPLVGEAIEEVIVGQDEDANLAFAVEQRLAGLTTRSVRPDLPPLSVIDETASPLPAPTFRYQPATAVPDHWHPYTREETSDGNVIFRQGRLIAVDASGKVDSRALPTARLLQTPSGVHSITPCRLPPTGVRLDRRSMIARTTTGAPVFWIQRHRSSLLSMPSSGLRFDALTALDDNA